MQETLSLCYKHIIVEQTVHPVDCDDGSKQGTHESHDLSSDVRFGHFYSIKRRSFHTIADHVSHFDCWSPSQTSNQSQIASELVKTFCHILAIQCTQELKAAHLAEPAACITQSNCQPTNGVNNEALACDALLHITHSHSELNLQFCLTIGTVPTRAPQPTSRAAPSPSPSSSFESIQFPFKHELTNIISFWRLSALRMCHEGDVSLQLVSIDHLLLCQSFLLAQLFIPHNHKTVSGASQLLHRAAILLPVLFLISHTLCVCFPSSFFFFISS